MAARLYRHCRRRYSVVIGADADVYGDADTDTNDDANAGGVKTWSHRTATNAAVPALRKVIDQDAHEVEELSVQSSPPKMHVVDGFRLGLD